MKKDRPAKDKKKIDSYTSSEVGALFESLRAEIKVIGENHSGLDKRLGDIEVEIHANSEKLTMLGLVMNVTKDKVSHLDNRVSLLDKKVGQLDEKVSHLDEKVDKLDQRVSRLDEKVDKLDQRVSQLDEKVGKLDHRVIQLDDKVDKLGKELKLEIHNLGNRLTVVERH